MKLHVLLLLDKIQKLSKERMSDINLNFGTLKIMNNDSQNVQQLNSAQTLQ